MASHLTPDDVFTCSIIPYGGKKPKAMTAQQCMSLPLQVQCITNRMCHDDKVDISGHTKKKQGGGTRQHRMGWGHTQLMFHSLLENGVVLTGEGF